MPIQGDLTYKKKDYPAAYAVIASFQVVPDTETNKYIVTYYYNIYADNTADTFLDSDLVSFKIAKASTSVWFTDCYTDILGRNKFSGWITVA